MSVFANQPSSGEKLFARYFQNYFEIVMAELNDMTNNDTTKWRNGLKDIGAWNDSILQDEISQFMQTCPDADTLFKAFDLDHDLKTFLHKIMIATSQSPAVIDRHYWTYPHRDRQAFLVDTIAMAARSLALASRKRGESAPERIAPPPPAPTPVAAPEPVPLPDESVSQASAPTGVAASTFSFDKTQAPAEPSAESQTASRASSRFPSQVSRQSVRSKRSVKEFSIVSQKYQPQSAIRQPITEETVLETDLETGIEFN